MPAAPAMAAKQKITQQQQKHPMPKQTKFQMTMNYMRKPDLNMYRLAR